MAKLTVGDKVKGWGAIIWIAAVLGVVGYVGFKWLTGGFDLKETGRPSIEDSLYKPGAFVTIKDGREGAFGGPWVYKTLDWAERASKAYAAKDEDGLKQLEASNDCIRVENGTKLKILDDGITFADVRVLDGPHAHEEVYAFHSLLALAK